MYSGGCCSEGIFAVDGVCRGVYGVSVGVGSGRDVLGYAIC